ncbi:glycerol-3-phosphate dehydrogenase [NAD(+)], cytoplasmic-like [Lucilia cuprina]|uniref:glycerol-3-phosphate dehydrogenase [NAD(+)], cytoplasmic-like n=1 Tax=Lucilia cuprina TaxID=7375 RepID=UPI001F05C7CD|nr:glycerol-3-phosphate dehydrogenase [NAD(+)], cytoplasmic-like [Lucilia cuprina]
MEKISVCVIGSGNWATAIAKIVAENALNLTDLEDNVNMYVYEEQYEGKCLSDLINKLHINKKYAPQIKLPDNVVAVTDLVETAKYADIIIFVMPHPLIPDFCKTLLGKIKPDAMAVSVTKGFTPAEGGGFQLVSQTVTKFLKIPCAVLMGANLASELALNNYCEATIGCRDAKHAKLYKDIFESENFRVTVVDDADCVEVCGFLKHILSFGAGLLDGFDCNTNTKAACIRFGFLEMIRFIDVFYAGSKLCTMFESCGLADLITVCTASRSRRIAEAFVKTERPYEELEQELLGGEKLLGPIAAKSVSVMLKQKGLEDKFPLFTTIHKICQYNVKPEEILNCIRKIPDIIYHPTNVFPL